MVADKRIRVSEKVKKYLNKKKKYNRETFNDVLVRELKLGGEK